MRQLHDHKTNSANDLLTINVVDEPGSGGAHHVYFVNGFDPDLHPSAGRDISDELWVVFQCGPITEVGLNGITHEALLAIVMDRLRSFQAGPYACRENALALTKIEEAMHWLHHRTADRLRRGVEGTHQI